MHKKDKGKEESGHEARDQDLIFGAEWVDGPPWVLTCKFGTPEEMEERKQRRVEIERKIKEAELKMMAQIDSTVLAAILMIDYDKKHPLRDIPPGKTIAEETGLKKEPSCLKKRKTKKRKAASLKNN